MTEVPKIVRQRLGLAKDGPHPDANLLAAFAEKSVTQRERSQIVEHLARCADCRQVVALAVPAQPAPGPVPARVWWLSWPVFRWATAAACVVVVGAAVLLRRHDLEREPAISYSTAKSANVQLTPATGETYSAKKLPEANKKIESKNLPKGSAVGGMVASRGDISGRDRLTSSTELSATAAPSAPSTLDARKSANLPSRTAANITAESSSLEQKADKDERLEAGAGAGAPAAVPAPQPPAATANEVVASRIGKVEPSARAGLAAKRVAPPADATQPQVAEKEIANAPPQKQKQLGMQAGAMAGASSGVFAKVNKAVPSEEELHDQLQKTAASSRWTLTPEGGLQHSVDAGRTWQAAQVPGNAAALHAVCTDGANLWVGGAGGVLYHSADAGSHWLRVTPTVAGKSLTADIVGIEFSTAQAGEISTSTHETWITSDGGATWKIQ